MKHYDFGGEAPYPVALLVKPGAFNKYELEANYVQPLGKLGVPADQIVAFTIDTLEKGKVTVKVAQQCLTKLLPALDSVGVTQIYIAESTYFKVLTKQQKAEPHLGYAMPCAIKGFEHMTVVLGMNYQQLIHNPVLQERMDRTLATLAGSAGGTYKPPGAGIIHEAIYPEANEIRQTLEALLHEPVLTCDIEAFSLKFWLAGIGTIAFAPDQHRGVAFPVDYQAHTLIYPEAERREGHGRFIPNKAIRQHLRWFFENYKGKLIFHNANYDIKIIVTTLFMESLLDYKGMLCGIDIMCRDVEDTKIIAYLALNSTAGNTLGLKHLAHEFAGNWAVEDIKDIRQIPLSDLLQYNLVDCLSTWFVYNKHYDAMITDEQETLYRDLLLPSMKLILQIELTGMPMSKTKITEGKAKLLKLQAEHEAIIRKHPLVPKYEELATEALWERSYAERKAKAVHPDKIKKGLLSDFKRHEFNPGSGDQLQDILYVLMELPIIDKTDTGQPATGKDTLDKLINHTEDASYKEFIQALMDYADSSKILSTFIKAFESAVSKDDSDTVWLHGSFNIGGTVSGRLSSSEPNLQNLPAKSTFGKLVKEMFMGPQGWLFGGADFNSLEDYISALTSKDPAKLDVYLRGFDGHALRAAFYFKRELEEEGIYIDMTDPKSVNRLKKDFGSEGHWTRQKSKAPTFALTYQGTFRTLMTNLGWPEKMAKAVEDAYHELYKVSDEYIDKRLEQATHDGYVTVAFGLRVRTPLLAQVVWGSGRMLNEAKAEGRTAGNAMGQSYGLLNNRAAVDFMRKVWASKYRYDILPCALIHDAIYLIFKDDPEVVEWVNRELIASMRWQELPEIAHEQVKLGAALDIFYPSWANGITLPNDCDQATIIRVCQEAMDELEKEPA